MKRALQARRDEDVMNSGAHRRRVYGLFVTALMGRIRSRRSKT